MTDRYEKIRKALAKGAPSEGAEQCMALRKRRPSGPVANGYCHYCGKTNDLRPYGPRGAMVCFDCAMSTPERKAETEHNFAVQLDAAGPVAMIDGTEVGPYPAKHAKATRGEQ